MLSVDVLLRVLSNSAKCHGPRLKTREPRPRVERTCWEPQGRSLVELDLNTGLLDPRLQASSLS